MKINDIFNIYGGNSGLTEEIIYKNQTCTITDKVKICSSALIDDTSMGCINKNTVIGGKKLKYYNEPLIIISRNGNAGELTYVNTPITNTDHAYVLIPKDKYKNEINLIWFSLFARKYTKECITNDGSNATFSKDVFLEECIPYPFPDIKLQNEIVEKYSQLELIKSKIEQLITKLNSITQYEYTPNRYKSYKMLDITLLNKGSNKISEEMIYKNFDKNGIPVYSSATENNGLMGSVSKECFDSFDKKGNRGELTWTTNGYAGVVFYRDTDYLYSEKCGRIVIRKEFCSEILPKYLFYILNQITYKYKTAESNNGKLDIIHMQEIPVKIPVNKSGNIDVEEQKKVIQQYERIEKTKCKLQSILKQIDADLG